MPNRILKESICTSEEIDQLSWFEEVVWNRLLVNCDDYGRFDARPPILKSRLFPLKENLTTKSVERAIDKLSTVGLVTLYEYEGRPYLQLVTWDKHQQVRAKKSKYPALDSACKQRIAEDSKCPRNPIQSESESESKKNPTRDQPPPKRRYGEFQNVLLSDDDLSRLQERWPDGYQEKIEQLSEGMERKGYQYKNHYLALLKWNEGDLGKGQNRRRTYDIQAYEELDFLKDASDP